MHYRAHGPDSRSDHGCWEVIVLSKTKKSATVSVKNHLIAMGREDRIAAGFDVERIGVHKQIIHSTVEYRY